MIRDDDRAENLEWSSHQEQQLHKKSYGKSGFKGVHKNGKKWQALFFNPKTGKLECLGTFDTREETGVRLG